MTLERVGLSAEGPDMPRLVVGCMRHLKGAQTASVDELAKFIEASLEMGLDWFDHADIYGGYRMETHFGGALGRLGACRKSVRIITKCGIQMLADARPSTRTRHYDTSPAHIRHSVTNSLSQLGVERIDLMLIHRPDPLFDAAAVGSTLDSLIGEGLIAQAGVSNFTASQFDMLQSHMNSKLVTNQLEHSLTHCDALLDGSFDNCQRQRIRPMLWSPIAALGSLDSLQSAELAKSISALAQHYRTSAAGIALAWALHHPTRPVAVVGTTRLERLRELIAASQIELDRQHWFELYQAAIGHPIP